MVIKGSKEIIVTFLDGRSYKAEIIGVDEYTDIAVLHVNTSKDTLTPLLIGDSSRLKVGESIAAIGNPFGLSGSMTAGIVSQRGRLLQAGDTAFQTGKNSQRTRYYTDGCGGKSWQFWWSAAKHVRTCSWNEYCDTV